jgi:hypothetical protein
MNKGTQVQGLVGLVDGGHAGEEGYQSVAHAPQDQGTFPLGKKRANKAAGSLLSSVARAVGECNLPEKILEMRPSGLKIRTDTLAGHLEVQRRLGEAFGATHAAGTGPGTGLLRESELVLYSHKALGDSTAKPELDVTADPKRALRRMLLRLKRGAVGRASVGVRGARGVTPTASKDPLDGVRASHGNGANQSQSLASGGWKESRPSESATDGRRRNNRPPRGEEVSSASTHVLMCELSVLLGWVWGSFWPGGAPLTEEEEAEVGGRFDDWCEVIQQQRGREVYRGWGVQLGPESDNEGSGGDAEMGDCGTSFSAFAGWFLVLVEYLLKVRSLDTDYTEGDIVWMTDEEEWELSRRAAAADDASVRNSKEAMARRANELDRSIALRTKYLRRRLQVYEPADSADGVGVEGVGDLVVQEWESQEEAKEGAHGHGHGHGHGHEPSRRDEVDRRVVRHEQYLRRRVQVYDVKSAEEAKDGTGGVSDTILGPSQHAHQGHTNDTGRNDGMDNGLKSSVKDGLKDSMKDALFGQDAPAPYEFVVGGAAEAEAEAEAARERAVVLRRRFLSRRVQGYGL